MTLRFLEHVHGHLGWLAVAALLHPAVLLRNPRRRALLSVWLATTTALTTGVLGVIIYGPYRTRLKQGIFLHTPHLGWCFERKEHLAVGVLGFAVVGLVAHLAAPRFDPDSARRLARMAFQAYVVAFGLALVAACLGVAVAATSTFGDAR